MRARTLLIFITIAASLAIAPIASAQSTPTGDAYNRSLGVIGEIDSVEPSEDAPAPAPAPTPNNPTPEAAATEPAQASSGNLPFTGVEVAGIALFGALLLGTGFVLRRRVQPDA